MPLDRAASDSSLLGRLLRPRSVAVLGGREAAEVVRQCKRMGYAGEIWPVHPEKDSVEGHKAYRSVAELPGAPDAAFVAVNRHLSVEMMTALATRGTGGAVAYASGFAEAGADGAALQAKLVQAAGTMPFLGPNCYGFLNYLDGVPLWPDQHGGTRAKRGVGIVTQSGNIALNLTMQKRGLPIGYLVTLGNQAAVGLSAAIESLAADPRVSAIGLHIEGIAHPERFARAAQTAHKRGVPIVALKTGRSEAGARLTVSHTASIAGADAVVDAFLRRCGIVQVRSVPAFLETLKLLHVYGPLPGRDIASMSCSGGEAALIADAVGARRLNLRELGPAQRAAVAATLSPLVTVSNPLDYHTFAWAKERELTETFAAMMVAGYDMTLLILDFPRSDRCLDGDWEISARALAAAAKRTGGRAAVLATLPECLPEARAEALVDAGIVPFLGMEEALEAIECAADAGAFAQELPPLPLLSGSVETGEAITLSEIESKQALAKHGLTIPAGRIVREAEAAVPAAGKLGYPVVVKASGRGLAHKSERGAVRLNLKDDDEVRAAAHDLAPLGDSLLIESMVPDAVAELIVGVSRDPAMGLYLLVGSGGVLVELIGDSKLMLLPASRAEVAEAIGALKVAKLLAGFRGKTAGDVEAAIDAVMAVQDFALTHAGGLLEIDVNPLIVRPKGKGAVAVDALIRLTNEMEPGEVEHGE